jgi:DNA polymerase epsilon subunit 1
LIDWVQACDFNRADKNCLRKMEWTWRGEKYSAKRNEYLSLKTQLESEVFPAEEEGGAPRYYRQLTQDQQQQHLTDRLKKYCQKVYKKVRKLNLSYR